MKKKKDLMVAVSGRSAAALLREAVKRSLEDTTVREKLAVQMMWDGPGFNRTP